MNLRSAGLAIATILTVVFVPSLPHAVGVAPASVSILLDLGDGMYYWSNITIQNPTATNASWNATLEAAAMHGLTISWTWYSCCGVGVTDIGGRNPPAGFVGLLLWNRTSRAWEFAATGISGLVVKNGEAMAWYNAAFNAVTFEGRLPIPTPDNPYPATEFRGDLSNTGASISRAPNSIRIIWDRDTGATEIGSTPSIGYGKAFVNTMRGLLALDETNGRELWRNPAVHGMSSPAIYSRMIIVGGSDGNVRALNASDGSIRWNVSLLAKTQFSGITSSPKVAFDHVYVGTFNESGGPGEVVSMWASNGTIAWRRATGSIHFSSAAFAKGVVYIGVMGTFNRTTQVTFDPPYGVLALDATNGHVRWFSPTGGSVAASPVLFGDRVVVASKDGYVYELDAGTGGLIWKTNVAAGVSTPALYQDVLFVGGGAFGSGGRITALRAATGDALWTFQPNGPVQASLTYADGKVFFSTNAANGTVYALDAATGEPIWEFEPKPSQYILGSPIVADGKIFAPSDNGHVYALGSGPQPTLNVTVEQPPKITAGDNVSVNITLRAPQGRLTNVTLNVTFVAQKVTPVSPRPAGQSGLSLVWKVDSIPFGAASLIQVKVVGICPPPPTASGSGPVVACGTNGSVAAIHANYSDSGGARLPELITLYRLTYWATTAAPPLNPAWVALVVATIVGLATVTFLLYRRRRHGDST